MALRSGQEQRKLCPSQFEIIEACEEPCEREHLVYTEFGSKNNNGGLHQRKVRNKSVKIFANTQHPERCVVGLFKKYMAMRPSDAPADVLYLQPVKKPLPDRWYQCKPVGHNMLGQTVKRLCDNVKANGFFTNHSLRRTCATRLYRSGADEQEIMSITGHRSKDGVRAYKRMNIKQEEELSDMLQNTVATAQKRPRLKIECAEFGDNKENVPDEVQKQDQGSAGHFNFTGCNVTFNNFKPS